MGLKIMVVDDDTQVLKVIKTIIEALGVETLTMADSLEAAERVRSEKFDGVFVDSRMPNLDGFGLAKTIRASTLNSQVPIVMLTGYSDVSTMRQGFQAGITFFLAKPVSRDRMAGLLRAMRGSLLRERRRYARLPYRTYVNCHIGDKLLKFESVDISEGGLLLEPSGGVSVGQEVNLAFVMPQSPHTLRPRAKVVRKEPPDRIAVQFFALSPEDRGAIQDYISCKTKG